MILRAGKMPVNWKNAGAQKMLELYIAAFVFLGIPLLVIAGAVFVERRDRLSGYPLEQQENWGSQDIDHRNTR